jgi:hypothetical protein
LLQSALPLETDRPLRVLDHGAHDRTLLPLGEGAPDHIAGLHDSHRRRAAVDRGIGGLAVPPLDLLDELVGVDMGLAGFQPKSNSPVLAFVSVMVTVKGAWTPLNSAVHWKLAPSAFSTPSGQTTPPMRRLGLSACSCLAIWFAIPAASNGVLADVDAARAAGQAGRYKEQRGGGHQASHAASRGRGQDRARVRLLVRVPGHRWTLAVAGGTVSWVAGRSIVVADRNHRGSWRIAHHLRVPVAGRLPPGPRRAAGLEGSRNR